MASRLWLSGFIAIMASGAQPGVQASQELFRDLGIDSSFADRALHTNTAYKAIVYDPATEAALLLKRPTATNLHSDEPFILQVEPGLTITVRLGAPSTSEDGLVSWSGLIANSCNPYVGDSIFLTQRNELLSGSVRYHGQLYLIRPINDRIHAVVKVNERLIRSDSARPRMP